MSQMIFLPFSTAAAVELRAAGLVGLVDDWVGYSATADMMRAHDYGEKEREDAEYVALKYASVQSLAVGAGTTDARRLVIAADLPAAEVLSAADSVHGAVQVRRLRWNDVRAVFVDEQAAAPRVQIARAEAQTLSLPDALQWPSVEALMNEHDLLWHLPSELDQIIYPDHLARSSSTCRDHLVVGKL